MKALIKILFISLAVIFASCAFFGIVTAAVCDANNALTFLLVGFDESPANTDVISVASYDGKSGEIRVIQIPRDTYVRYDGKEGKINGIFSHNLMRGKTESESLSLLREKVSSLLGVKIDGYVAVTTAGFIGLVDHVGGVDIESDKIPQQIRDKYDKDGDVIYFDGAAALDFVRYRKDYLRGDLERLDVQKSFMKAFLSKVKGKNELFSLFKFVSKSSDVLFDINKSSSFCFALKNGLKLSGGELLAETLPGSALKHEGVWYYIVKREEAALLIEKLFKYSEFDKQNNFIYNL